MATVTHIIRSRYDPADRDKLERETGQDPWQTESSFSAERRLRAPPTFVPAAVFHDEWGVPLHTPPISASNGEHNQASVSTAEWYRSLTSTSSSSSPHTPPRPSSAPSPATQIPKSSQAQQQSLDGGVAKDAWFIRRALRSEPLTKPSSPAPTPSLADLLARDPPPLPSERRYVPPVWLHIGPSNRGFGMLQRSGWSEGEGLGAHVARSVVVRGKDERVENAGPEIIDLTQSDSEASLPDAFEDDDIAEGSVPAQVADEALTSHIQKSLLTPLPIVLKADRLGIGLKAKTEGPYKRSKKRVTHNAAALAAHIKAAEELRRKKVAVGRGTRGFSRVHRREEDSRKAMLSYLNE